MGHSVYFPTGDHRFPGVGLVLLTARADPNTGRRLIAAVNFARLPAAKVATLLALSGHPMPKEKK
jgi:hypothetical protein